jgi:RsiW-degrading membrane proteinase PrsW (M82 family)
MLSEEDLRMGMTLMSFTLALLPSLILVYYFNKKDSLKPEPKKMIRRAFFVGILSTIPAIIVELSISFLEQTPDPWLGSFMRAFVVAAFVEEMSKYVIFRLFIYNDANFDEIMDGILYMAIVSLGFAGFENVMYVVDGNISIGLLRAFTAVPGHAIWSGIMGYYIGLAKIQNTPKHILTGLSWGIAYHGAYDFVIFAGTNGELSDDWFWLTFLIIPILIIGAIHLGSLMKKAKLQDARNMSVDGDGS